MRQLHIHEALGSGAFGTVYSADLVGDRGMRRRVAVKVMSGQGEGREAFVTRIRDEARLLGMLQDNNILAVLDLLDLDGRDAVVMEWVDGVDLEGLIRAGHRLPLRALANLGAQVAGALHKAHTARHPQTGAPLQVVHRDVKPANVMLTATGHLKLLDFGIAKAAFDARESRTGNMVLGTLYYLAPEYILRAELSPSVDVYGLALVLIESAGGQRMGKPRVRQERFEARRKEMLADLRPEYRELVPVLRRMLAWEPAERPDGAACERLLLEVADRSAGTGLRTWCGTHIPRLQAARAKAEDKVGLSGSIQDLSDSQGPSLSEAFTAPISPTFSDPTRFEALPPPAPVRPPPPKAPKKKRSALPLFLMGIAGGLVVGLLVLMVAAIALVLATR